jgi:SAM-dependent methyltransferase
VTRDGDNTLAAEEDALRQSWEKHDARFLDQYLVGGVEDPRINLSSVLVRGLLADSLFPGQFDALVREEARFSAFITWYLKELESGIHHGQLEAALFTEEGLPPEIAAIVRHVRTKDSGVPDYTVFQAREGEGAWEPVPGTILDSFVELWKIALSGLEPVGRASVVEVACGSANDYRALHATGLAAHVDYTGFDIAPSNILNARRRFPGVDFHEASSFALPLDDKSRDYGMAFDLFEHLSLEGMERSLEELLRVTRKELWLGFFNLGRGPVHRENPVELYHCNEISETALVDWFHSRGHSCAVIRLPEWQMESFGVGDYYNEEAAIVAVQV